MKGLHEVYTYSKPLLNISFYFFFFFNLNKRPMRASLISFAVLEVFKVAARINKRLYARLFEIRLEKIAFAN